MRRAAAQCWRMRRLLITAVLLGSVTACGGDGPTAVAAPTWSGTWHLIGANGGRLPWTYITPDTLSNGGIENDWTEADSGSLVFAQNASVGDYELVIVGSRIGIATRIDVRGTFATNADSSRTLTGAQFGGQSKLNGPRGLNLQLADGTFLDFAK